MPAPPKIDRYDILGQLGKGANGIVYLGRDSRSGREVALKIIHPTLARDPVVLQRFHREAKAISRLSHVHVLTLLDYSGPHAQTPYLVTERLHGKNLDDVITDRGSPLDATEAAAVVHDICLGLQHAHSLGIVHRDLKPENVFLEPDGRIVLCDFGIARSFDSSESGTLASSNTRLAGSPLYMSPEQIAAPQSVGPASDMFSLGSLLYFLVSGHHAFIADTVVDALKRVVAATPDDLRAAAPGLPERLYRIVDKLLAKDPSRRFTSAQAIADALQQVVKDGEPRRSVSMILLGLGKKTTRTIARTIVAFDDLDDETKTVVMSLGSVKPLVAPGPPPRPKPPVSHRQTALIVVTILGLALIAAFALVLHAKRAHTPKATAQPQ